MSLIITPISIWTPKCRRPRSTRTARVALSGDYYTEAHVDTSTVPLDTLMATYASNIPQGFKGQTEFHATLKGPLKDKSKLEAHLSIPVLNASYQSLQIGIASPIHADYANSVVTLQPAEIRGTGTSLRLQGRLADWRDERSNALGKRIGRCSHS